MPFKQALLVSCIAVFLSGLSAQAQESIAMTIENDCVKYVIGPDGRNLHFIDKRTATDYCAQDPKSSFAKVRKDGKEHEASAASYSDGKLTAEFGASGVSAVIKVTAEKRCLVLEVSSISDESVQEFAFADIPLTLKGRPEEPFAGCALALNLKTRVPALPGPGSRLKAMCYPRFGFAGAKVALIGCPQGELREAMKEVVSAAPDLPRSSVGGPWALDSPDNYGSYLMTSRITEEDVDDWIRLAKDLGFRQIDYHGGGSFRFGDFEPSPKIYPKGKASLKAVIDRLHAAGILVGLHTYAFFIAKTCPWVTPSPDPRLGKDAAFTLADALTPEAAAVPVEESTKDVSNITGFFVRNSVTLQIDDELITYGDVSREPPYGFTKCKRGVCGTRPAPHAKGAKVQHLKECFGLFTPDADSTLLTEVAAKTAEMYNECGFDMIYLDALDGEDVLGGRENGWHYGSKFTFEICKRLKKPAIMEMSTFHHHLWYVRSRMGAWDHPSRSHKKFIDIHCAANESCRRMFLPANLGWWSFKTWTGALSEPTFADDIEYWCGKALANDSSLELSAAPATVAKTPALPRLAAIVKQYEELRRANYFTEEVKQQLRVPGDEFTLVQGAEGERQFRRVQYDRHRVEGLDGWSDAWKAGNKFARQPLQLRIEALLSAGPYDAPGNVTLADFRDANDFAAHAVAPGITATLTPCADVVKAGPTSGRLTATSAKTARERSWAKLGKVFEPALGLAAHQAMGVWVHGDGKGEVLNLQLKSPPGFIPGVGDHYIIVDFNGWRYFELIEPEGRRYADYSWPYGGIYSIYRENVTYKSIHALNLFVNNLPAKDTVTCCLSPVRAVPTVTAKLRNPSITVGGKAILFPVEMDSGSYLEYRSAGDCRLFGPKGEELSVVKPQGDAPVLEPGENQVKFTCEAAAGLSPRAGVTIITQGDTLRGRRE